MRRAFNPSYLLIPFLYLAVIFVLIVLQFTGGRLFNVNLGPINLRGAFEMGGGNGAEKTLSSLSVGLHGLNLVFDHEHPVVLENTDDTLVPLELTGYTAQSDGYVVNFSHNLQVFFRFRANDNDSVEIAVDVPNSLLPLKSVRLNYASGNASSIAASQTSPGLEISADGVSWNLALPLKSFVDAKNHLLVIAGDSTRTFAITQRVEASGDTYASFFKTPIAPVAEKDYGDAVTAYINSAYNAWRSARYNSNTGTWSFRDADNHFSEGILTYLLAEAWNRNEYTRIYNDMRSAADMHPTELTWKSSAFLGNLRHKTNEMRTIDQDETKRLKTLVSAGSLDVFAKDDLFKFVLDRGDSELSAGIVSLLQNVKLESIDADHALDILKNYYLADLPDQSLDALLQRFSSLLKTTIIPNIVRLDEWFFYQSKGSKADTYKTVLAGRVLQEAGKKTNDAQLVNLGRSMVLSVLKQADDLAYVPQNIEFSGGSIISNSGNLGPETFYPWINSNPSLPVEYSLYSQLGQGTWIYTLATINKLAITSDEYRLTISYPRTRTHFIIFAGIPNVDPYEGMNLFGRVWRNDPDFENWAKGRYYNPDSKILMIKYYDDSIQRDIIINPH